ncbi:MAG: hypothetical protein NUW22_10825 [Acidobacteria bacterium]|nr:hypothetical protein [Acidobacteriota bacterium]
MSDNFREFDLGVKTFTKNVPEAVRDFRDAIALEGLKGVVLLTPVDTGRARGNWQTSIGAPAEGEIAATDMSGRGEDGVPVVNTFGDGASTVAGAADPFGSIWLHNGLSYIGYLNDGTDKIPAVHMLEQTVERLVRTFKRWKGAK